MLKKAVALIILLTLFLSLTHAGKSLWRAAFVLPNLIPDQSFRPLDLVTHAPTKKEVNIPFNGGSINADLYLPGDEGKIDKALLLISGASLLGKDDSRIVNFGETLSRAGIAVLIPDFNDIAFTKINPRSVDEVTTVYEYILQAFPGKEMGMAAFSVATGPMFLASAKPEIKDKVDFLISFGGYYNLKDVIRSATTGDRLDPTLLPEIKSQFNSYFGSDTSFDSLLKNTDPAKFDLLYDALTPDIKSFIASFSPQVSIKDIEAKKVFLIHSDPDPDVPTAQSEMLKEALGARADLTILRSFSHTDVKLPSFSPKILVTFYIPETAKLYDVVFKVLNF